MEKGLFLLVSIPLFGQGFPRHPGLPIRWVIAERRSEGSAQIQQSLDTEEDLLLQRPGLFAFAVYF
jgi:hypothetical protein